MDWVNKAVSADLDEAVAAISAETVTAAGAQASRLLGEPPAAGDTGSDPDAYETAWQLLTFRLLLASTPDVVPAVAGLRRWGTTWDLIARAAGMTRQSAHERWSAPVRSVLDRYGTGELGGPVPHDD